MPSKCPHMASTDCEAGIAPDKRDEFFVRFSKYLTVSRSFAIMISYHRSAVTFFGKRCFAGHEINGGK